MNFLGHCYFSELTPTALAGSLWPDFGRKPNPASLNDEFLTHFDRHQWIDKTTDSHPLLEPIRQALRPHFRKTSPLVLDMLLDHHLAKHWSSYHPLSLDDFASHVYQQLHKFADLAYPDRFQKTFYWMERHNWLVSYREMENTVAALEGISKRIRFSNPIAEQSYRLQKLSEVHHDEFHQFLLYLIQTLPEIGHLPTDNC